MIIVSVISSSMWRGSAPVSRTIDSSVATRRRDMNCRAEMLIETLMTGRPSSCHCRSCDAGGAEHPFADGHDEPQLLGDEDEVLRVRPRRAAGRSSG